MDTPLKNMAQIAINLRHDIENLINNVIKQIATIVIAEPKRTLMFDNPTIFGLNDDLVYLCGLYAYNENRLILLYKEYSNQSKFYKELIDSDTSLELICMICDLINKN